ncbi:efflux RND transporter permease subunit [Rhodoflexus caldus]|uniref:efflux RND transporter permease subunit n=1 Tax=Rhodoflexus caldus TaxID=2891236 RepID=UPI00202A333D|nr:efflux RND transporter permease subunit [Rhodoflexus caldus]
MSLSTVSIRRPVLTVVLNLAIVIFGIIGFRYLGVREYPNVETPVVSVFTSFTGANAEVIESQITEPLEEAINGIPGIASITSTSSDGRSSINIEFDLETNIDEAANDVRDKVSGAVSRLPAECDPPVVAKADANGSFIISLYAQSDKRSTLEITAIGEKLIKERLQTIPGVSGIRVWGEKKYAMRLIIDVDKLAAYQLTPLDVRQALLRENVELPSGRIEGNNTELTVKTFGRLVSEDDFNNLVIKQTGEKVVTFADIGKAKLTAENEKTIFRRDGRYMVGYAIEPQPGANQIAISDEFYKRLEQIRRDLPEDIDVSVGFDDTKYIRASIAEVQESVYIAFALVAGIIFLFLRDWRTTVIPLVAIPVSLIGAFFIMYVAGFTINVLTMLGIVLAIGLVVDDAIVVLENIYAKIEEGMTPMEAGFKGAEEIFFAVISTTIALAAVFMPVIFLQGITGKLFKEFGVVIAGSVIISSFVALTLTTMMSSRLLKRRVKHNWFYNSTEGFFVWLNRQYEQSLESFMRVKWLAFPIIALAIGLMVVIFKSLPQELAPLEDRSSIRISITGPEGSSFEFMDSYMVKLLDTLKKNVPEANAVIGITSPPFMSGAANTGMSRLELSEPTQRKRSQQEIADMLNKKLRGLSEARAIATQSPTIGNRRSGQPVQFVIQAPTLEKLREVLPKFLAEAQADPTLTTVDVNLKFTKPEIRLSIDRDKANTMGVNVLDIAQTLQLGFSGMRFGYFIMNGKQYQVIGEMSRGDRNEPLDLRSLYVKNRNGNLIQLDNLVTLKEESSPPALLRYNRFVSATVSATPAPGKTIGDGLDAMYAIADRVLDESFTTALAGQSKEFKESSSSLLFAFGLALVLIYLVLAGQFESFRDPLIIMFTVPLALAGALLSLWYFKQTLNIFSQIGMIMLIGLVTKNAILIVEFANQKKEQGLNKLEAVKQAAEQRFRPILMTALSTILGTLPIALALGAGAESRVSMGIAVIGGMMIATGLTLYIIPAIYAFFSKETSNTEQKQVQQEPEELAVG